MNIKPIIISYENGEEYTLEFSRESVTYAEEHGFSISDVPDSPMVKFPELFYYSFRMHHPKTTRATADRILFEDLGGVNEEIVERLLDLYNQAYETLINSDGEPSNPKVTVRL